MVAPAGKSSANQIVLPSATDYASSATLRGYYDDNLNTKPNSNAGDPQWLGILEGRNYSPALSSTNQFVSRSASIVVPTDTSDFADIGTLGYQPRAPVLVTNADVSGFAYYLDLNRNGRIDTNGFSGDEMLRRQAGGVAWSDNMHSKNGDLGFADGEVQQMSRSKLQEGLRSSSGPAESIPVIDPRQVCRLHLLGNTSMAQLILQRDCRCLRKSLRQRKCWPCVQLATRAYQSGYQCLFESNRASQRSIANSVR